MNPVESRYTSVGLPRCGVNADKASVKMRCVCFWWDQKKRGKGKVIGPSLCCSGGKISTAFTKSKTTLIFTCSTKDCHLISTQSIQPYAIHTTAMHLENKYLLSAQESAPQIIRKVFGSYAQMPQWFNNTTRYIVASVFNRPVQSHCPISNC